MRINGMLVKRNVTLYGEKGKFFTMTRKVDGLYCGRLCVLKCPKDVVVKIDHVYQDRRF